MKINHFIAALAISCAPTFATAATPDPLPNWSCEKVANVVKSNWFNPNYDSFSKLVNDKNRWCLANQAPTNPAPMKICERWDEQQVPGNYVRVIHDDDRNKKAIYDIQDSISKMKSKSATGLFSGFVVQIPWGQIDTGSGALNTSVIDEAIAELKKSSLTQDMNILLSLTERTFHADCDDAQTTLPPNTNKTTGKNSAKYCTANTWEPAVSQRYQEFVSRVYAKYKNEPMIIGSIISEESSLPIDGKTNALVNQHFEQYVERAKYLGSKHPNMMTLQGINWPNEAARFTKLAEAIKDIPGAGITWPDTAGIVPIYKADGSQKPRSLLTNTAHYDTARQYGDRLIVAGGAQTPDVSHYAMDVSYMHWSLERMKSPIKIWDRYYSGSDSRTPEAFNRSDYLNNVIDGLNNTAGTQFRTCGG